MLLMEVEGSLLFKILKWSSRNLPAFWRNLSLPSLGYLSQLAKQ